MGYESNKRGKSKGPPFVAIPWEILNGNAYKGLSPSAAKLLPFVLGKLKLPWKDSARLRTVFEFSIREAMRSGNLARGTSMRAIHSLQEVGFLDVDCRGSAFEDRRVASKFRLSDRWRQFGSEEFEFVAWEETRGVFS